MHLYRHSTCKNLTIVFGEVFAHTVSMTAEDAEAIFEAAFTEYSDAIFRYLFFQLGDRERATELTQEVFMRYWQQVRTGERIAHTRAYVYRIAHNLFVNEIRTDKRTRSLESLAATHPVVEIDEQLPVPERAAEHAELMRYLSQLDEAQRTTLILRFIEGWTVRDIAAHLNERENTISMRINRALAKLKSYYTEPGTMYHTE